MRKINKETEPESLTQWKRGNPNGVYDDLERQRRQDIRQDIRRACASEQHYLCAYCCDHVSGESSDTMNEHIIPRSARPDGAKYSLVFTNIVASCKHQNQCDSAHGHQNLPLTPLMVECEQELKFRLSGKVEGVTERAKTAIDILNLGDCETKNKALIEKRKRLIHALLWAEGLEPQMSLAEEDELLKLVLDDLKQPQQGKLEPFAPCLVNVLEQWLAQ